jgi:iron complex transport system permease protein
MNTSIRTSEPEAARNGTADESDRAATSVRDARRRRTWRVLGGLVLLLGGAVVLGLGVGAVAISPGQVLAILGESVGLSLPWAYESRQALVLTAIRLPRVLLGMGVGGGLAVSGAVMQGLFRNPLADPSLIGVSSGAALAAVVTIVLGPVLMGGWADALGPFLLPAAAFAGGVGATVLVYRLGTRNGQTSVATMLLAGIAINALAGAGTGLMTFIADDDQLRDLTFWTLGSLGGATWTQLAVVGPCLLGGMVAAPLLARPLNALLLGEGEAFHLGIDTERTKKQVVTLAALVVGAAVAVSGVIGFIGLVVPHLLRLAVGPDHRVLIPGSALLGGALLLGADVLARTIVAPAELPIGIVTALVGAPFFLWLLLRDRNRGTGYSF